jgi:L-threonylcarbamoyladenylate synthase
MNTVIKKLDAQKIDQEIIQSAAKILKDGGLVAFPTETVYGLGAYALDETATKKIYGAKGRPSDNPLIVHISNTADLNTLVSSVSPKAQLLINRFWPGPLTLIFNKNNQVPKHITGGLNTVAVRIPSHPIALALLDCVKLPIAAPSANTSGRPSPTSAQHVIEDLNGKIDMIIDGGKVNIGLESTVLDVTMDTPMILRPGYITQEMLEKEIGEVIYDSGLLEINSQNVTPRAPGMKYRHYAPKGQMVIVDGPLEKVASVINEEIKQKEKDGYKVGVIASHQTKAYYKSGCIKLMGDRNNTNEIASRLFEILRVFDDIGVDYIYTESFREGDLGQAIMNRLLKAAGYQIIYVK